MCGAGWFEHCGTCTLKAQRLQGETSYLVEDKQPITKLCNVLYISCTFMWSATGVRKEGFNGPPEALWRGKLWVAL